MNRCLEIQSFQSQLMSNKDRSVEKGWGSLLDELGEEERIDSKTSTEQSTSISRVELCSSTNMLLLRRSVGPE